MWCKNLFNFLILLGILALWPNGQLLTAELFCPAKIYDGRPGNFNAPQHILKQHINREKPIIAGGSIQCRVFSTTTDQNNLLYQQEVGVYDDHSFVLNYADYTMILQRNNNLPFDRTNEEDNIKILCPIDKFDGKKICYMTYMGLQMGYDKRGKLFFTLPAGLNPENFSILVEKPGEKLKITANPATGMHSQQVEELLKFLTNNASISLAIYGDNYGTPFSAIGMTSAMKLTKILWELPLQ